MLTKEGLTQTHPFFSFSDSSWDDDMDNGQSTGCYIITYMGDVVNHSSNLPNPVAHSSAEAEYNEGCLAMMATSHLRMLLAEFEGTTDESMEPTTIYFDSKSAIAMGSNFHDTNILDTSFVITIMFGKGLGPKDSTCNGFKLWYNLLISGPKSILDLAISFWLTSSISW